MLPSRPREEACEASAGSAIRRLDGHDDRRTHLRHFVIKASRSSDTRLIIFAYWFENLARITRVSADTRALAVRQFTH
jgi:hypothetical protein